MILAKRILKLRKNKDMSREELAQEVISYSYLSNIEKGRSIPNRDILIHFANRLEVPEDYLLKHDHHDEKLEQMLEEVYNFIMTAELLQAKRRLRHIKEDYEYIYSTQQEFYYLLLKALFLFKNNEAHEGIELYKNNIDPIVEERLLGELPNKLQSLFHHTCGLKHFNNRSYTIAYNAFIKQLDIEQDELLKHDIYFEMSRTLMAQQNNKDAIYYAENAVSYFIAEKEWLRACQSYNLLGALHWEEKNLESAELYLQRGLDISDAFNIDKYKPRIYFNLGLIYKSKKEYNKALNQFLSALELQNSRDIQSLSRIYRSIIILLLEDLKDLDGAQKYIQEAKEYYHDNIELEYLKIQEANLKLKLGNAEDYECTMTKSIENLETNGQTKHISTYAIQLAQYYESIRSYKKACKYYSIALKYV